MVVTDPTNGNPRSTVHAEHGVSHGPLPPTPSPGWSDEVLKKQLDRAVNEFHYTSVAYSRACLEGLAQQLPSLLSSLSPRGAGAGKTRSYLQGPSKDELLSILEGTDHRVVNQPWRSNGPGSAFNEKTTYDTLESISHISQEQWDQLSQRSRDVIESYWWSEFGGSDEFYQLRLQSGALPIPLAIPSDRRGGTLWPIWRTEQELNRLRMESRIVSTKNCYGQGLLLNKTNYVIHTGYTYGCRGKDRKHLMAVPSRYRYERDGQGNILTDEQGDPQFVKQEKLDRYAEMTMGVVEDFLARNQFTTTYVDGLSDNEQVMPREKESYVRVQQDGDAVLRFFFHGKPKVRIPGKRSLLEPAPSSQESKDYSAEGKPSTNGSVITTGHPEGMSGYGAAHPETNGSHGYVSYGSVTNGKHASDKKLGSDARGPILMDLDDLSRLSDEPVEEEDEDLQGKCSVRFIEPECIVNPPGGSWGKGWAVGKHFKTQPAQDLETLLEIYVKYQDDSIENVQQREHPGGYYIPGWQLVWIKPHMELASTARGLPWFSLDRAASLRRAEYIQRFSSQTASEQARTSEIWRHLTDTKQNIQQMAAGIAALGGVGGASQSTSLYGTNQAFTQSGDPSWIRHGGIARRVGTGQEAINTSELYGNPFEQHLKVAMGDLTQVGAASGAPAYMVSGDSTGSSYANAVQAGNPFVRSSESEQGHFRVAFLRCLWKAVRWAVECGILPIEVMYLVEITAEATQVTQANNMEKAQVASLNIQNQITSRQIEARKIGNDWDRVAQDNQEFNEQFGQQGGMMGLPGGSPGGGLPGGAGGGGAPPSMQGAPGGDQPPPEGQGGGNPLADLFGQSDQGAPPGQGAPTSTPESKANQLLEAFRKGSWIDVPDDLL